MNPLWAAGNRELAHAKSKQALQMRNIGAALGAVGFILYVLVNLASIVVSG